MRRSAFILPALIVGLVLCLFVPLPTQLLDVLLAVQIALSVVILASVVGVADPVDLSSFPTILLMTTSARLALDRVDVAKHPAPRLHGRSRPDVREVRRRRQRGGRPGDLRRDHDREPHGDHQGLGAGQRGRRALQPRCHAGQADGRRRRHGRRAPRRALVASGPPAHRQRERLLRRDGRSGEVREGRRHRQPHHRRRQPARRVRPRRRRTQDGPRRRRPDLLAPDGGRWTGRPDPCPAARPGDRHARQPRRAATKATSAERSVFSSSVARPPCKWAPVPRC